MGLLRDLIKVRCGYDLANWPSRLVALISVLAVTVFSFVAGVCGLAAVEQGWFHEWTLVNGTVVEADNNGGVIGTIYCTLSPNGKSLRIADVLGNRMADSLIAAISFCCVVLIASTAGFFSSLFAFRTRMYRLHIAAMWCHVATTGALFFAWVPSTYIFQVDYNHQPRTAWAWDIIVLASGMQMFACLAACCACLIDREYKIEAERAMSKDRDAID